MPRGLLGVDLQLVAIILSGTKNRLQTHPQTRPQSLLQTCPDLDLRFKLVLKLQILYSKVGAFKIVNQPLKASTVTPLSLLRINQALCL